MKTNNILKLAILSLVLLLAPSFNSTAQAWQQDADQMGILYFYKPSCGYCKMQAKEIEQLQSKYGWKNVVSVNIQEKPETANNFGVSSVPDVWLIAKVNGEIKQRRISTGYIEENEIVSYIEETHNFWWQQ